MLQFLTSRKLLFVAVVILLLTWIMFLTGGRAGETSAERFLRIAVAPVEGIFDGLTDSAGSVIRTVGELHRLTTDNRRLLEEIDRVAMENQILRGYQLENERLRGLLGLSQLLPFELLTAEVVSRDPNNWHSRLTINLGAEQGVVKGMCVIAAGGVVGRIEDVRTHRADVSVLTDTMSKIGGVIERTGTHVLVRGQSSRPGYCEVLPYGEADFQLGDQVVVWEESDYFPRGLAIGEIINTDRGQGGLPTRGILRPVVNPSQLDVVFVIVRSDNGDAS